MTNRAEVTEYRHTIDLNNICVYISTYKMWRGKREGTPNFSSGCSMSQTFLFCKLQQHLQLNCFIFGTNWGSSITTKLEASFNVVCSLRRIWDFTGCFCAILKPLEICWISTNNWESNNFRGSKSHDSLKC